MTEWEQAILIVIASLRTGEVVSYGDIARRAGNPRAARSVGRLLASTEHSLPWWRVIRADGTLLRSHRKTQTELLTAEGVVVKAGRVRKAPLGRFS
ncbi:MAG: MGMT family protein [bacterium]|nr:MGMT family protein [bacterium]